MTLNIDTEELKKKNQIIDDAIAKLKSEFVGIDEQIDSVMNSVRVWYLYPQLQASPCVVNLFGMTGCGKTSLIKRIASLLDLEKNLVYFNFCAINEQNSWEIEESIEEQLNNECSNRMFVYDEFQYAATLDETGAEKDNKNGLKPFWELLDTGILHKRNSFWIVRCVSKAVMYMSRINAIVPMEIVNGKWTNYKECISHFNGYEKTQIDEMFNHTTLNENGDECECKESEGSVGISLSCDMPMNNDDGSFFLKYGVLNRLSDLYFRVTNTIGDVGDIINMMSKMSTNEIIEFLADVCENAKKGYDLKFNESIIFVVANLDEAYNVAFNVNPDMSPDQFYKITKKISIVDAKKALQKRFRNEQIARLGNTFVIYPSFSSKSFKEIIDINLKDFSEDVKTLCGLEIQFDKTIKKIIYDESVYPTHGTRPVFSTIHEVIKTKLPHILKHICDDDIQEQAKYVVLSYKKKKVVVTVYDEEDNKIGVYKFDGKMRLDKLRASANDEIQANTAVHESGHFVVYSYLNGRVPEKLISRSASSDIGGFMMENAEAEEKYVTSKQYWLDSIKVCLGGYAAEGIVFGEYNRSNGASSDLQKATMLASRMVREWGLEDIPYFTTHLMRTDLEGMVIKEEDQDYINKRIKCIIDECLDEVVDIIKKPNIFNMLKKSSKYLSNNSQMPKNKMVELLEEARKEGEIKKNNENFYRNIVNNL